MPVKLSNDSIRMIAAFEKITEVHAIDCLIKEGCIYFVVSPEKIGLVIGRNGKVIRELRKVFGRPVRVFGYYDTPEAFLRGVFPSAKIIETGNKRITLTIPEEERISAIGKNGENINAVREIMNRHFSIKSLKIK
ncbi:MAG: NusA-like transcription termination signal-binding factor [Candidatus Aenigmatarchaeota archaeon]